MPEGIKGKQGTTTVVAIVTSGPRQSSLSLCKVVSERASGQKVNLYDNAKACVRRYTLEF